MTSKELYEKLTPSLTRYLTAQRTHGLQVNTSEIFTQLIKEAARCNSYSSDVFYDLCTIDDALRNFKDEKEFEPIWIGFRRHGVDGTSFVLCRIVDDKYPFHNACKEYFALYSVNIEHDEECFYKLVFNQYSL